MNRLYRRQLMMSALAFGAGSALIGPAALAQAVNPRAKTEPPPTKPYKEVTPRMQEDKEKVLLFFSYTCLFCRQYDVEFYRWGNTFPGSLTLEAVPVVGTSKDIPMAKAFYVIKALAPEKIAIFNHLVFEMIQDNMSSTRDEKTYITAANKVGVSTEDFHEKWQSKEVIKKILEAKNRLYHYDAEETPTLIINGRYLVSAGYTRGDYNLLFQLASGLISQQIEAQNRAG